MTKETIEIVELLEHIAKALVPNKDKVAVTATEGSSETTLSITAAQSDVGKILGKKGRIIDPIRIVIIAAGMNLGKRFRIIDVRGE